MTLRMRLWTGDGRLEVNDWRNAERIVVQLGRVEEATMSEFAS